MAMATAGCQVPPAERRLATAPPLTPSGQTRTASPDLPSAAAVMPRSSYGTLVTGDGVHEPLAPLQDWIRRSVGSKSCWASRAGPVVAVPRNCPVATLGSSSFSGLHV